MGAECCGGSKTTTNEAAAQTDFGPASERLKAHADDKSWESIVADKKSYYDHRVAMFEQIRAKYQAAVESAKENNVAIAVTMPDGSQRDAVKGVTTPMDIAIQISKGLAKKSVVAKVDGQVWDLMRPLESDCSLELLTFDDADGKDVRVILYYRHDWDGINDDMSQFCCRPFGTPLLICLGKLLSWNSEQTLRLGLRWRKGFTMIVTLVKEILGIRTKIVW